MATMEVPDTVEGRVLSTAELVGGLDEWSRGSAQCEAAVGLLIAHRYWLVDDRFLRNVELVRLSGSSGAMAAAPDWACLADVERDRNRRDGAKAVLAAAVEIVNPDFNTGWSFGDVLAGLDRESGSLVVRAACHARRDLKLSNDGRARRSNRS
jgi:hypothetical protein